MPSRKRARPHSTVTLRNTRSNALFYAAANGDVGTVERLLSENVEVNAVNTRKRTGELLHVAAENGHAKVVEVLLNNGADFNEASKFGNSTPVHLAALGGHVEVLSVLLRRGAAVDAKNKFGRTPLHLTASQNKPECAKLLLDFKAKVNVQDVYSFTPFHLAARNGCVEIVRMLLNMGADVNVASKRAYATPLHLAAANGHVEVVKLFLEQKVRLDVEDVGHKTPLDYAIGADKIKTAELLFNHQNMDINNFLGRESNNLLHKKSRYGHVKTIVWILSKGANVNAVDLDHETPLHFAAMKGHPEAVKVLLSAGASVNAADRWGDTPLHLATEYGFSEVVNLLLSAGASVNAAGECLDTPLHLAAEYGSVLLVELLLSAGASVNATNELDVTPLHLASDCGFSAVVKLLLTALADVNAINADHNTPLNVAYRGCKEVLNQHVVKMMVINLFVNESNTLSVREDGGTIAFQLKCEEEIELMKSQKINNGISFFDILTKKTRQLIMYARNKDILRVFKSNVYLLTFPLYGNEIKNRFIPAIERGKLLESCHKFFDNFLADLPRLEYLFTEEILMHLSNSDLQLLRDLKEV